MPEGFVLDSSSYFVETLVGQADDVEGVCYLHSVREHPVIRLPVRTGHVQHRPADPVEPLGGLGSEPRSCAISRSTTDYVEPAGGLPRRRQRCTKPWCATGLSARTTLLVDAHSPDLAYPIGVGPQEGFAPADDLVVHRMPITTQFCGDLVDRTAPPTHLDGHPPGRSGCQQRPLGTNRGVLLDERPDRTVRIRARPPTFPPPQPNRPTERR